MKKWIGFLAFLLFVGIAPVASGITAQAQARPDDTIMEGVYAGEISLAGMTQTEAQEAVQAYVDSLGSSVITLNVVDGNTVTATASELGMSWSNQNLVSEAVNLGKSGNVVARYKAVKDLEHENKVYDIQFSFDQEAIASLIENDCAEYNVEAVDAHLTRVDGEFVIEEGQTGVVIDNSASETAVYEYLTTQWKGGDAAIDLVVTEEEPQGNSEDLALVKDVLGTYTTSYSSSGSDRSANVSNGCELINGTTVYPGESFSTYEAVAPFTEENGYYMAGSYLNGQVVDSIGGGVCQIATTLYNTALQAELEITQRQNHSMIVTYVKPSMDAAIAGTYKDIKITNNYSTPIYVEGYTENKKLTFTIYGKETRPANRTVEYVSETLGTTSPGEPQLIVDNSLAPGARVRVQSSHTGLRSRLWKVVTVDGVETERTLLHTDSYNASKAIYRVGPTPVAAPVETAPAPTDAVQPTEPQVIEGVNGGPGVTAPAQTEAPAETAPAAQTEAPAPAPEPDPQSAAAPAETAAPEGAAVVPVAQAAEFGNREALG